MYEHLNGKMSRRRAIAVGAAAAAGGAALLGGSGVLAQEADGVPEQRTAPGETTSTPRDDQPPLPPGEPGRDYTPVVTPNNWTLPYKVVDGVKVFHLIAEEVPNHEFAPGLVAHCWGYNGSVHGPTIEAVEGDRVRIYVTNRLAAPTTVHWHGFILPNGMDGVGGLNQRAIKPGETFVYEFPLKQNGTFMYHSHHDEMTQAGMGMIGMFIVHPRGVPPEKRPDRDFAIMLAEWRIDVGTKRPNPNEMKDFNVLTMNARAFPGTFPLVVKQNDRVRIRLGNLSMMDHHPIHLHNYSFRIVETDGGQIPESAQWPETTVLVAVGQTRAIEFVADAPGDWAMHCHMFHHVMNQMGHDIPNMIGVNPAGLDQKVQRLLPAYMTMGQEGMGDMGDMGMAVPENSIPMVGAQGPFDYITMGGMFTILKVRESLPQGYDVDPGWYEHPPRTVAWAATAAELRKDGIDPKDGPTAPASVKQASRPAPPPPGTDRMPGNVPIHGGHPTPAPAGAMEGASGVGDAAAAGGAAGAAPTLRAKDTAATVYTCPMHPEVVSNGPGRCPKCKMKLVAKKK